MDFISDPPVVPRLASPALRVLIAEDNPVNQAVAAGILEKNGHAVILVANGREAVESHKHSRPDLILMDIQMPELDGVGAMRQIRAADKSAGRRTPIIAMTADAMSGDSARVLLPDMDAYISKPLTKERLLSAIENVAPEPLAEAAERGPGLDAASFNRAMLLENLDGDLDMLAEVTKLFAANTPGQLASIRDAITQRDSVAVERSAHLLLGSLKIFGAERASEIALALQSAGQLQNFGDAAARFAELEKEIARICAALA